VAVLVTLDEEAVEIWKKGRGKPADATPEQLRDDEELRAEIQAAVDEANKAVSRAESIRVFRILPRDFSESTGEMTPSMKVKRAVVLKQYAGEIAAIYGA
jgi:long-chain acyl-CoA synthetase